MTIRAWSDISGLLRANAAWLLGSETISRLFGFVTLLLVGRSLGTELLGAYIVAFAAILIGSALADLGISQLVVREIARSPWPHKRLRLVNAAFTLRLALSIPIAIGAGILAAKLAPSLPAGPTIVLVAGAIMADSMGNLFAYALRGLDSFKPAARATVASRFGATLLGMTALMGGLGLTYVLCAYVIAGTIRASWLFVESRRRFGLIRITWAPGEWRAQLPAAMAFSGISIVAIVYLRADVIILSALQDEAAVTAYGVGYRLLDNLQLVPATFMAAAFPAMVRKARAPSEPSRNRRDFMRGTLLLGGTGTLLAILGFFWGGPAAAALFGNSGAGAAEVMRILVWYLPFLFVRSFAGYVLYARGRERDVLVVLAIGTLVNLVSNLLFVPVWAEHGAAFALLIFEALIGVWLLYLAGSAMDAIHWKSNIGRRSHSARFQIAGLSTLGIAWGGALLFLVLPGLSGLKGAGSAPPFAPPAASLIAASVFTTFTIALLIFAASRTRLSISPPSRPRR